MKVLMLTTSYPRYPGDYAGNFIQELAKELVKDGVEISVLAPHDTDTKGCEEMDGVRIHRFQYFRPKKMQRLCYGGGIASNMKNPLALLQLPLFFMSFLLAAHKVSSEADLLHAHWMPSGMVAAVMKRLLNKPFVLTVHGSDINKVGAGSPLARVYVKVFKSSEAVITVSDRLRGAVLQTFPYESKVRVIRNGVDTTQFKPNSERRGECNRILYGGRLSNEKGVHYLIEAFSRVIPEYPGIRLTIAGDGPMKKVLMGEARKWGVESKVEFIGFVNHKDMRRVYLSHDIFVLPSLSEGLPLSVVEAMSCGLPIIATDVGGVPEIIKDRYSGLLVRPGDVEGLEEAIKSMINDAKMREKLIGNALELARGTLSIQQTAKMIEGLYSKAAGANKLT